MSLKITDFMLIIVTLQAIILYLFNTIWAKRVIDLAFEILN